jgi:hypothetical protein
MYLSKIKYNNLRKKLNNWILKALQNKDNKDTYDDVLNVENVC